jgi:phage-related protein
VASYTFIYNGVNLTNLVGVRTVDTTVLPPRENHAITIWERPGSIYNSYRFGERTIKVTFLIRASQQEYRSNPYCMENKLNTLRNVFKVAAPKALYLGSRNRYILAVPEGDFRMTELRYDCYECEIQFICHNPEYYSSSVSASNNLTASTYGMRGISNNSNTIEVYNGGNASAYPIINIGINNSTSFVQVENTTNGNKFLLGSYPKAGIPTESKYKLVFNDDMSNSNNWATKPKYPIDSNRDQLGSVGATEDGSGIIIASAGGGSSLWKGVSAQRQINDRPVNFELKAMLHLNSSGVNGDPTVPQLKEGAIDPNSIEYFYKVVAPSVPIRATQEIYGDIVGSCNKGESIFTDLPITNGWIQTEEGRYCEAIYFKKYIADTSESDVATNVAIKEGIEEINLMSRPSDDPSESILLATIPSNGLALRVHKSLYNGYYKLYVPYNGKIGYIDKSMVEPAKDMSAEYPVEDITVSDDYKTGICEVYGYSESGTKLFKLCLSDENRYYSFVTPTVYVGDNKVLEDITTVSGSNKAEDIDEYNVGYDYLLDNTCDWNNFYGELGIRRENNRWQAWIYKIENGVTVKKLIFKEQEVSGASDEPLHYIVVYMGAQDPTNMCGISITNVQVKSILTDDYSSGANLAPFNIGDEIKIDCYNAKVYLNNKLYNDIDIGSQFIELVTGNNVLKFASEDYTSLFATVLFNERYL